MLALHLFLALLKIGIEFPDHLLLLLFICGNDDVRCKVHDLLQSFNREIEEEPEARGGTPEEPDVRHGDGEVNVRHALATDNRAGDLHTALLADNACVADTLVLAAEALVVLRGAKNTLAEESIGFRALCPVVHSFWLCHFPMGPAQDVLGGGHREHHGIEAIGLLWSEG